MVLGLYSEMSMYPPLSVSSEGTIMQPWMSFRIPQQQPVTSSYPELPSAQGTLDNCSLQEETWLESPGKLFSPKRRQMFHCLSQRTCDNIRTGVWLSQLWGRGHLPGV